MAQMKTRSGLSSRAELWSSFSTYGKMPTERAWEAERRAEAGERLGPPAPPARNDTDEESGRKQVHAFLAKRGSLCICLLLVFILDVTSHFQTHLVRRDRELI